MVNHFSFGNESDLLRPHMLDAHRSGQTKLKGETENVTLTELVNRRSVLGKINE